MEQPTSTAPKANENKDDMTADQKRDLFMGAEMRKQKKARDKARKERKRAEAKPAKEGTSVEGPPPSALTIKIPKLSERIVLKPATEKLLEEAAKKEKKELRWMWIRLMTMKKDDAENFEATVFADMTSYLDGKTKLPPYVGIGPKPLIQSGKRKATTRTGDTPEGKKPDKGDDDENAMDTEPRNEKKDESDSEPEAKKALTKTRVTLSASDGMSTDTWDRLKAMIWDVQDEPENMWEIIAIEGEKGPKTFFVPDEEAAERLKKWLNEQKIDKVTFSATAGTARYVYENRTMSTSEKAGVGLFQFRLVIPFSVKEDIDTIIKTFVKRNAIPGVVKFVGLDHEAAAKCKNYAKKPSRIPILLGDGDTIKRMLDVAIEAKMKYDNVEEYTRCCYRITAAKVPARYNLKRVREYVRQWTAEKEKELSSAAAAGLVL